MSSGYIPAKDEPGPDEILEALREAVSYNPRLAEIRAEEVARQLVLEGHLQEEPSPALVADMLITTASSKRSWGEVAPGQQIEPTL